MAGLRNNPQFATIRSMIQADPASLPRLLQELSNQNPQLMQVLQQNQGEFLRMLMEPAAGGAQGGAADALQQLVRTNAPFASQMLLFLRINKVFFFRIL